MAFVGLGCVFFEVNSTIVQSSKFKNSVAKLGAFFIISCTLIFKCLSFTKFNYVSSNELY